jgi:uncharacterized protein (TIGR02118 family)
MKLIYVLRRKPGMSLEEFQRYWRECHGPLVARYAATLGIRRYVQVHTRLPVQPVAPDPLRGPMQEPYDGVAELWLDAESATGTPHERREAARLLAEDEAKFIDFSRSAMWRGEERIFVGDPI